MNYYLYIKTHNKTGLKYLGKTSSNDPHKYSGSGKYWRNHLEKHGYDYITEILLKTEDENELKETGLYFSKIFNVLKSNQWANLKNEEGDGGWNIQHIMNKKYNVDYVIQHPTFKEKQKETFRDKFNGYPFEHTSTLNKKYKETLISKYGVDNPMKTQEIKEKHIKSVRNKYGVDHPMKSLEVKEKHINTFNQKYNGYNFNKDSSLNKKYKETLISKYGVDNPMKNQEIKEKAQQTILKKYGVDNVSKLDSIKEKKTKTNLEKFGCKHPNKGRIIITNGKKNKFCNSEDIPKGWWKGKTLFKKD